MHIPLRIRLLHNFGRSSFTIGFLFALIGLAFIVFFSTRLNWKILLADKEDFQTISATITEFIETQYSINENFLHEYHYRYSPDELNFYAGTFLEFPDTYRTGQEIQVEYLINAPGISRFSGKDHRNYNRIMFLAGVLGILFGLFFLIPSIRKTRKERKILMAGMLAEAKLIHAEPTNLKVNEQTVYKLTYQYSTYRNKSQKFFVRSHLIRNLSEDHSENLIYDPGNPEKAIIVDTLPGSVARFVAGRLEPAAK